MVRDARVLAGLVLGQLVAFPNENMLGGFLQKQDFAVLGQARIREDHEDAFLLVDAAEVEQVVVLPERHGAVGIGRHHVVGLKNGQRSRRQQLAEAAAVFNKKLGSKGGVAHGRDRKYEARITSRKLAARSRIRLHGSAGPVSGAQLEVRGYRATATGKSSCGLQAIPTGPVRAEPRLNWQSASVSTIIFATMAKAIQLSGMC